MNPSPAAIMKDPAQVANGGGDRFIPIRRFDLLDVLVKQGDFASKEECEQFRRLAQMLRAICHYEYSETLERLRNDYYYFSPEMAARGVPGPAQRESAYADLVQSLDKVLKDANFKELPHADVIDAHRRRSVLPVEVKAHHDDFRDVRFYRRGHHMEQFEVAEWFGLRRRKVETQVFDDVVLLVAMKPQSEIGSRRELRMLKRRKIVPGSVLLKYFRNIACGDLYALFPNARVVMSNFDKVTLGVPAIAGGIPILLKLYATLAVLFVVIGYYLGASSSIADKDMATALAALTGLVALGGFIARQWLKYQRQSLKYHIELTENIYYRNVNNNAGIFDTLIATAEDQECKEALLAYHFLRVAPSAPTGPELAQRIETWLERNFGVEVDFAIGEALATLDRFGLVRREGQRLFVSALDAAIARLHRVWDDFFPAERGAWPRSGTAGQ